MTDISNESLLTIKQARDEFPNRVSIPTLWRWVLNGTRGVVLESVLIGGRRYTSKEACLRFIQASSNNQPAGKTSRKERKKMKSIVTARAVLDQFGV